MRPLACARSGNCALKVARASNQGILFNSKDGVPSQRCRGIWMQCQRCWMQCQPCAMRHCGTAAASGDLAATLCLRGRGMWTSGALQPSFQLALPAWQLREPLKKPALCFRRLARLDQASASSRVDMRRRVGTSLPRCSCAPARSSISATARRRTSCHDTTPTPFATAWQRWSWIPALSRAMRVQASRGGGEGLGTCSASPVPPLEPARSKI